MKEGKHFFLLGCFLAILCGLVTVDPGFLEAVSRKVAQGILPRELRQTVDLGLYNPDHLRRDLLDAPVARAEFGRLLRGFLKMLGAPGGFDAASLAESGIFDPQPPRKALSRKQATEVACRAVIHLADLGLLTLESSRQTGFPDYAPPAKYQPAMAFLTGREVIRGYPDGSLHAARAITTREAIYLLFRLYEAVSAHLGESQGKGTLSFVDLPVDHPMIAKARRLQELGAFDRVKLRASFDGESAVPAADLAEMIAGILDKAGKNAEAASARAALTASSQATRPRQARSGSRLACRGDLALLMHPLASGLSGPIPTGPLSRPYVDVPAGAPELPGLTALERYGIYLGYSDGRLAGLEPLSWFEAVGILHAYLERVGGPASPGMADEVAAQRADFEEFAALIKAKKDRIRGILDRKPRYRRD
ncbi:MAG: hypothetical protein GX442_19180 [Candidatus Riflebacteria bacterium]|nr:hypothetical protein [Candidatus Riflebacteria bacterium]